MSNRVKRSPDSWSSFAESQQPVCTVSHLLYDHLEQNHSFPSKTKNDLSSKLNPCLSPKINVSSIFEGGVVH